jgi:hypothetical protein
MLQSFFVTFVKQGRLWEMEHALRQPDPQAAAAVSAPSSPGSISRATAAQGSSDHP